MRGRMTNFIRQIFAHAILAAALSGFAAAETVTDDAATCPAGAVSVYFAPGESLASDETVNLIGRVGAVAVECHVEGVDIVAWVDPAEGQDGMSLALERLKLVTGRLGESGLTSDRMRVGARVQAGPERFGPGSRNVRIILRDDDTLTRTDTKPPAPVRQHQVAPEAI